jgi:polyhydroxyalkanoate synthase
MRAQGSQGRRLVIFAALDGARRSAGHLLEAAGFGPARTPARPIHRARGLDVLAYREPAPDRSAVLLVPAPIKRAYIWDLAPGVSVVRRCLDHGLAPFVIRWRDPDLAGPEPGLGDYAGRLLGEALEVVSGVSGGRRVALVGHSLGGTLAAIHAALSPDRVSGAVLIGAPLRFAGEAAGAFAPLLVPSAWRPVPRPRTVPGTALDLAAVSAAGDEFVIGRWADGLASAGDPAALALHLRVERWALDELALPGPLFGDVVEALYRDDAFYRGALVIDGRRLGPSSLVTPLLAVIDPSSRVVPPAAVVPFLEAAASRDVEVLEYRREVGVGFQHVGPVVGRNAHRYLWPRILAWLSARA